MYLEEGLEIISFDLPAGQFCSSELSLQSLYPSQRNVFGNLEPSGHVKNSSSDFGGAAKSDEKEFNFGFKN